MKRYPIVRTTLFFTALVGVFSGLMAGQSDEVPQKKECEKVMVICTKGVDGGEMQVVDLKGVDLKEGETRVVNENGRTITLTRKGEKIEVTVDGRGVDQPAEESGGQKPANVTVHGGGSGNGGTAAAGAAECAMVMAVERGGQLCEGAKVVNLDECEGLKEGETKVIEEGGHTITLTRKGGQIEAAVDGRKLELPDVDCKDGKEEKLYVHCADEKDGVEVCHGPKDIRIEKKVKVVVLREDGGCAKKMVLAGGEECGQKFEEAMKGLADGETRTVQSGGRTLTVARKGDAITVTIDGENVTTLSLDGKEPKAIKIISCTPNNK